jgi:outer membrane protein assembly factor BamB
VKHLLGFAAVVIFTCAASGAEDSKPRREWPCFHGPRRDNKSAETGLLKTWPKGGPRLLWTATGLGGGYSSVTIAGGRIYTAGRLEKRTYVFALGLDGKQKWKTLNGDSWEATRPRAVRYVGARATPTCDGDRVYHLGERGRLAALRADTGKEAWHLDLFKMFDAGTPKYGLTESVVIDGDRLICSPGGARGFMVCLEKATGKLVWATKGIEGTVGYNSPVIATCAGVRQIVSMSSAGVFGVDLATGRLLWSAKLENARQNNATDPIVDGDRVFASSGYGAGSLLLQLAPKGKGVAARQVWANRLLDNHHGGVVLVDGHLYGAGHRARGWTCLEFATGRQRWSAKAPASGKGSLTYADGMLYCLDETGTMSLLAATPEAHKVAGSFALPKGGSGQYWAHPVVCDGRLYVRHADRLFAYDIRAR